MEVLDEKGRSIPFVMSPNERNFMDDIGRFSIVLKPQLLKPLNFISIFRASDYVTGTKELSR